MSSKKRSVWLKNGDGLRMIQEGIASIAEFWQTLPKDKIASYVQKEDGWRPWHDRPRVLITAGWLRRGKGGKGPGGVRFFLKTAGQDQEAFKSDVAHMMQCLRSGKGTIAWTTGRKATVTFLPSEESAQELLGELVERYGVAPYGAKEEDAKA